MAYDNHSPLSSDSPLAKRLRGRFHEDSKNKSNQQQDVNIETSSELTNLVQYMSGSSSLIESYFRDESCSQECDIDNDNRVENNAYSLPSNPPSTSSLNLETELKPLSENTTNLSIVTQDLASTSPDRRDLESDEFYEESNLEARSLGTGIVHIERSPSKRKKEDDASHIDSNYINMFSPKKILEMTQRLSPPKLIRKRSSRYSSCEITDESSHSSGSISSSSSSEEKSSAESQKITCSLSIKIAPRQITYSQRLHRKKKRTTKKIQTSHPIIPLQTIEEVELEEDLSVLSFDPYSDCAGRSLFNASTLHPFSATYDLEDDPSANFYFDRDSYFGYIYKVVMLIPRPLRILTVMSFLLLVITGTWFGVDNAIYHEKISDGNSDPIMMESDKGVFTGSIPDYFFISNTSKYPSSAPTDSPSPETSLIFSMFFSPTSRPSATPTMTTSSPTPSTTVLEVKDLNSKKASLALSTKTPISLQPSQHPTMAITSQSPSIPISSSIKTHHASRDSADFASQADSAKSIILSESTDDILSVSNTSISPTSFALSEEPTTFPAGHTSNTNVNKSSLEISSSTSPSLPTKSPTLYPSLRPTTSTSQLSSMLPSVPSPNQKSQIPSMFSPIAYTLTKSHYPSLLPSIEPTFQTLIPSTTKPVHNTPPVILYILPEITYMPEAELEIFNQVHGVPNDGQFLVHMSEFNSGQTNCEEEVYSTVESFIVAATDTPVFLLPSDNDYSDCPDPDEAWTLWNQYWGHFEDHWKHSLPVERQGARPENFAFYMNEFVLFVGVHIITGPVKDEKEHALLMLDNLEWTISNIRHYYENMGLESVVIFGHTRPKRIHDDYFGPLSDEVKDLNISVAYVHGDATTWDVSQDTFGIDNMMEVNIKAGDPSKMKLTVKKGESIPFVLELE